MHGELCIGDAINWDAPLNRGLVSWWLALPEQQRGVMFRDLAMRNHGTLTNGPTWQGAKGRPGGWGSMGFDGTDDFVDIGDTFAVNFGAGEFAFSLWLYNTNQTGRDMIIAKDSNAATGRQFNWTINQASDGAQAAGTIAAEVFENDSSSARISSSAGVVPANEWVKLGFQRRSGATMQFIVNGAPISLASSSGTQGLTIQDAVSSLNIGRRSYSGFEQPFHGYLDDVRIYSRALSDAEWAALHRHSRQGYPNELNWQRRNWYAVQDEGGGGGGNRRRRVLICGGAA